MRNITNEHNANTNIHMLRNSKYNSQNITVLNEQAILHSHGCVLLYAHGIIISILLLLTLGLL